MILCRDFAREDPPTQMLDIIRCHLKNLQFSQSSINILVPSIEDLMKKGRAILLVDGLDEIPNPDRRVEFSKTLTAAASRFPDVPMIVTSRVEGFAKVREHLANGFDHMLVGPLDQKAKATFITTWSKFMKMDDETAKKLTSECCGRNVASLTENTLLLAMIAQIRLFDSELPGRRIDVIRRAMQLLIDCQRPTEGERLAINEVFPHLAHLAYQMRKRETQKCTENEVVDEFSTFRKSEPNEPALFRRSPAELLAACIDSLGVMSIAGTTTDGGVFERRVVEFFHQSFQEYFAGQIVNNDVASQLRELLNSTPITEREIEIFGRHRGTEPVLADNWQETIRLAIADLKEDEADDSILILLPGPSASKSESRARGVFAMQCLADEPQVSDQMAKLVFDSAINCLTKEDAVNKKENTWMDEAIASVSNTRFGSALQDRLIEAYVDSRASHRAGVGRAFVKTLDETSITKENVGIIFDESCPRLIDPNLSIRLREALAFVERFYRTDGKLAFLDKSRQQQMASALVNALALDEATASAAMWALAWFTNAMSSADVDQSVRLDPTAIDMLLPVVADRTQDARTIGLGALVLTRDARITPVCEQLDWVYQLAVIADGAAIRRELPTPTEPQASPAVDVLLGHLKSELSDDNKRRVALALGRFGVFVDSMSESLAATFLDETLQTSDRDEAMVYLAMTRTVRATNVFVNAADTGEDYDDYLYARGLFGLIWMDQVGILASQLCKAMPQSDLNAYAFALAGSADFRGSEILFELTRHENERVRTAAEKALAKNWTKTGSGHPTQS